MFFVPRKPRKTRYLRCFLASGDKNHGIYNVFWPGPSENTGIYAVLSMLQEAFFVSKSCKNTSSVLGVGRHQKTATNDNKTVQNGPSKPLLAADLIFSRFFFDPQRTSKPHQSEGFFGGSGSDGEHRPTIRLLPPRAADPSKRPVSLACGWWCLMPLSERTRN